MIIIIPFTAPTKNGGTPNKFIILFITPIVSVPNTVPIILPLPPDILVPPITTDVIASISYEIPEEAEFILPSLDASTIPAILINIQK